MTNDEAKCWCYYCNVSSGGWMIRLRMNLCPDCGNKRCPRATDHTLACTNSNEPGQPGSIYEDFIPYEGGGGYDVLIKAPDGGER